ncbi:hypothetical protein F511_22261 [Dorcoceras hygrometricum]|uniref:Uncharacterized protein n=1 Tax=Dorcoceras hygrometricum TaxID=472368 RepID=A0A2Z7BGW7_9LAMI|nr:hypothetical protein F511_22261 [Dorcoceras hygrometricum]
MGATHSSQHTVPDAQHDSTRCCPTHEMWELPTPLIVANRSQQGDEVRELPAQPQQHPAHIRTSSLCATITTIRVRATQIHHLISQTQDTAQEPEHRKATAASYELDQRYSTPSNSTESSKQHKVESEHLPQQARTESDAYANGLQKGDVFAHLTSFKKTSESNIQTKRLSKRSPTLSLLLQSELSTVSNRKVR